MAKINPYQLKAIGHCILKSAANRSGVMVQGDIGCGKTRMSLALAQQIAPATPDRHVTVVICPCAVMEHFEKEARVLGGFTDVVMFHGTSRTERLQAALSSYQKAATNDNRERLLVITSVATFWNTDEKTIQGLFEITSEVILDESQELQNGDSPSAAFNRKSGRMGHYGWLKYHLEHHPLVLLIELTGTPVSNQRMDLYHQLALMARCPEAKRVLQSPDRWTKCPDTLFESVKQEFVVVMEVPQERQEALSLVPRNNPYVGISPGLDITTIIHNYDLTSVEREAAIAKHEDVKHAAALFNNARNMYPPHHPAVVAAANAYNVQRTQYRRGFLHSAFFNPDVPPDDSGIAPMEVIDMYGDDDSSREKATNPVKTPKTTKTKLAREKWLETIDPAQSSLLTAATSQLVQFLHDTQITNGKIAIFSEWLEPLKLLKRLLETNGVTHILTFFGGVRQSKRVEIVDQFNDTNNHEHRILLLSSKCGGKALNLTGAVDAMLLHRLLSPAQEAQAIGRVVRPAGQMNVKRWSAHMFDTPKWATMDNVFIPAAHRYKQSQASSHQFEEVPMASILLAVPTQSPEQARALAASSGRSSSSRASSIMPSIAPTKSRSGKKRASRLTDHPSPLSSPPVSSSSSSSYAPLAAILFPAVSKPNKSRQPPERLKLFLEATNSQPPKRLKPLLVANPKCGWCLAGMTEISPGRLVCHPCRDGSQGTTGSLRRRTSRSVGSTEDSRLPTTASKLNKPATSTQIPLATLLKSDLKSVDKTQTITMTAAEFSRLITNAIEEGRQRALSIQSVLPTVIK